MADISTDIAQWSATAGSNSPGGSTAIGTGLDDNLRALQAAVVAALNAKGSDIASASSIDLSATNGLFHDITGTTAITALSTVRAGVWKVLKFEGALTLTHNATSLILPGGANITTADGDIAMVVSEGSGNWRCAFYIKKSSIPVVLGSISAAGDIWQATAANVMARLGIGTARQVLQVNAGATALAYANPITIVAQVAAAGQTEIDFTGIPAGVRRITIKFRGLSLSGTDKFLIQIGDSGGFETSGYVSTTAGIGAAGGTSVATSTSGFVVWANDAADIVSGTMVLDLIDAATFAWVSSHSGKVATTASIVGGGDKALSAELTQVRITRAGTDTIDAGSVGLSYE